MKRRDLLVHCVKTGLALAGVGVAGYLLHDPKGPSGPGQGNEALQRLPDFSVTDGGPKLAVVYGDDRTSSLNAGLRALGGIERFVKKGDRVLIKVNAAFALPPALGATTHPELVSQMSRLCLQAGAASVVVTDNPINDARSCFALTGIEAAAKAAGARVVLPRDESFKPFTLQGGRLLKNWPVLWLPFDGVNRVIGMAPVKDHHRSGASMSMKNWYGLVGGRRNVFHQNIHDFIKELALMVKPTLVVLDGTVTMMTNGPTGGSLADLKPTHTLIVATDQVAADAVGAGLLGRSLDQLPFILKAQEAGVGTADYEALRPIRVNAG